MKKIVVFSGAGISAESGIQTFRDSDGLWENYNIYEVATPQAWKNNPQLVLEFYNARLKQIINCKPNLAHTLIADWQNFFDVQVITQNIDDLHERAGSQKVLHLHGEIMKARSSVDESLLYPLTDKGILWGDFCAKGSQLRPNVVWFGEEVPNMLKATEIVSDADVLIVVGSSLRVYPAAGLLQYVKKKTLIYLIDPAKVETSIKNIVHIQNKATEGLQKLHHLFIQNTSHIQG